MKIGKYIVMLCVTILILSMVGSADENNEKVNITVISESMSVDKNLGQETVLISINTEKTGYLTYLEKYYSKNETGNLSLDRAIMYYNNTMMNNTLTLRIKRPLNESGDSYSLVKAMVYIDNVKKFDSWFIYVNTTENPGTTNVPNETKESPGFGAIASIISITCIVHILKRRK